MNILVTGAGGFIASHLIPRLLAAGHTVTGTIRRAGMGSADCKRRTRQLEALCDKSRFQIARCEEFESLYALLQRFKADVCVHLAGKSWVRESVLQPELYEEANYRATAALLDVLRQNHCRKVVFASSVMVYGKDAPLPYMEDHLGGAPASPYGASKLACEVLLNTYQALHKFQTASLRVFSCYGPELRPDCVPHLIASAILKNKPFTVFGDGLAMRDYVDIDDVVSAFERAIDRVCVAGGESYPALNIGSGFGTTLLELVALIEKSLGKKAELAHEPPVAGELAVAIPDISLSMEKLNWEPQVSLEQGIERMADWFKNLPV
jgi:nucleoside-diphosphate-sugar epimerase